jgi:CBS domain-containing protein
MSKARDIMQKNVITIELEKTAQYALTILKDRDISFLVVENSKPVGIVSDRDIVRKIVAENRKASKIQLESIMSKKIKWVQPNSSIESAVQKMLNNN